MRVKEITLSEFLSFKEPTRVGEFSPGVNVIVGKNGSGKSNVLAAIRFIFPHEGRCTYEEKKSYFYEGNQLAQQTAFVEVVFDNASGRFPAGASFAIRRTIDFKRDELTLDGKVVTQEELNGLFESAGFSKSNLFFIVPQGEVERLSLLSDAQRYALVKEIAGAAIYERDRTGFMQQLEDTVQVEKKIGHLREKIGEKIRILRDEQKMLLEAEVINEEKSSIEKILFERELEDLNTQIKTCHTEKINTSSGTEAFNFEGNQEALKVIRTKMRSFLAEKSELAKAAGQGGATFSRDEYDKMQREVDSFGAAEKAESESLRKLDEEAESMRCELSAMEYEKAFLEANHRHAGAFSGPEIEEVERRVNACAEEMRKEGLTECKDQAFSEDKFQACINERKMLWIEEKNIDGKTKKAIEDLKQAENKIISVSGSSYQSLKSVKGEPGVHGCVYELISIPDELFVSVSTVMSRNFFSVVVDSDTVATNTIKKINKRLTFIPLNRIKHTGEKVVDDDNMIPLWEQISCEDRFRDMLRFLTNETYLVSDIKYATALNKKHNVNVVTLEGEYISRSGVISGGYETTHNIFADFKSIQKRVAALAEDKKKVAMRIEGVSRVIESMRVSKSATGTGERRADLRSNVVFFKRKLVHMRKGIGEGAVRKLEEERERMEIKSRRIEIEKGNRLNAMLQCRNRTAALTAKIDAIKKSMGASEAHEQIRRIDEKIAKLRRDEDEMMNVLSKENIPEANVPADLEERKREVHRNILLEKRNNLVQKLNAVDVSQNAYKDKYENMPQNSLIAALRKLCVEKKNFEYVNPKASLQLKELEVQHNSLVGRMVELESTRKSIEDFVDELDHRKESAINFTLGMVCDSFSYFAAKMCPGMEARLVKSDDTISIHLNGESLLATRVLSGGQKAVLALSLIFAIQRIDPSSFYVFDEIDANLDQQTRVRLCELMREVSTDVGASQFIFTTFKSEMLECGNKFFGVTFEDKKSTVGVISREEASRFLVDGGVPER